MTFRLDTLRQGKRGANTERKDGARLVIGHCNMRFSPSAASQRLRFDVCHLVRHVNRAAITLTVCGLASNPRHQAAEDQGAHYCEPWRHCVGRRDLFNCVP